MLDTIEKDLQEAQRRLNRVQNQYEQQDFSEVPVLEVGKEFEWHDECNNEGVEKIEKVWVNEDGKCILDVSNDENDRVEQVGKVKFLKYVVDGVLIEV